MRKLLAILFLVSCDSLPNGVTVERRPGAIVYTCDTAKGCNMNELVKYQARHGQLQMSAPQQIVIKGPDEIGGAP